MDIFATIRLAQDSSAVDLTKFGYLVGKEFMQVDGMCHAGPLSNDTVSLTLKKGWTLEGKDSGCLSKPHTKAHVFAVALVTPPPANGMFGGTVKNCQEGMCMVALNVPVDGVAQGADKIAAVCGDARHHCTVALDDFGAKSIVDHWNQLTGDTVKKIFTNGPTRANIASNIIGMGPGMNVGQGFSLAKQVHVY